MGEIIKYHPGEISKLKTSTGESISYLNENKLALLQEEFRNFYDHSPGNVAKSRARNYIIFLFLRFTGARISEVMNIDDTEDINVRENEVTLKTLKRHKKKGIKRLVPIPPEIISEALRIKEIYPDYRGKLFKGNVGSFQRIFKKLCIKCNIPEENAHPHILRHTRAIEMVRAGVPLTIVQKLLGHARLTTTAIYLNFSAAEEKEILKRKGLLEFENG